MLEEIPRSLNNDGMAYVYYNPNPVKKAVGDCVIRAISKALDYSWEQTYVNLAAEGYARHDMPSSNDVWMTYLRSMGFEMQAVPNTCPMCYTVADFSADHPVGTFVLGTGDHAVTVVNGDWYDLYDSGGSSVAFYFTKEV